MELNAKQSISMVFGLTLLKIVLGIILSIVLPLVLLLALLLTGLVLPANYNEKLAKTTAEKLMAADDPDELLQNLSGNLGYIMVDSENTVLKTDLVDSQLAEALTYLNNEAAQSDISFSARYIRVELDDASILLRYTIRTCYSIDALNTYLPAPDIVAILLIIILSILSSVIQVLRLSIRFKRELNPLILAAQQTAKQDFAGSIPPSKIKEISTVQNSFCEMREELKQSIHNSQQMQRRQKEQIMALVHDLKTPLTVTIGNLDLLAETELRSEQEVLNSTALASLEKLSEYISLLAEITAAENLYQQQFRAISVSSFFDSVSKQAAALCRSKQIAFNFQTDADSSKLLAEPVMLERAFMNVLNNAVRYTESGGIIKFTAKKDTYTNHILVHIDDNGCGFSNVMLQRGKQLFYSDNENRDNEHFGIGLYFANLVINKHNGTLDLANSTELGGASVKIELPLI